jgi:hypothetical protein
MKDPAFLFYPGDYLRDTQCFSEKTQVAYDRIICEHMRNIHITQQQLNFFTKKLSQEELNELLMALKFTDKGYQIDWVAESIRKRRIYGDSRRKNRLKAKKDMNNICKSHDEHMENENENEEYNKNKKEYEERKEKVFAPLKILTPSNAEILYDEIIDFFSEDLKPKTPGQKSEWIDILDKLMRIDLQTPEKIKEIIENTRKDDFWKSNFLSVLKLRRKDKDGNSYFTVFKNRINGNIRSTDERKVERVNRLWDKKD